MLFSRFKDHLSTVRPLSPYDDIIFPPSPALQGLRPGASTCRPAAADGLSAPHLDRASRGGPLPPEGGPARPEPLPLGAGQHRALQPGAAGERGDGGVRWVAEGGGAETAASPKPFGPISCLQALRNLEKEKCLPRSGQSGFYFSLRLRSNQSETCPRNPFILLWEADWGGKKKIWTFCCCFVLFVAVYEDDVETVRNTQAEDRMTSFAADPVVFEAF